MPTDSPIPGDHSINQSLRQSLAQFFFLILVLAVVIFGGAGVLNQIWS